jgi:hypothetical protein
MTPNHMTIGVLLRGRDLEGIVTDRVFNERELRLELEEF